MSFIQTYDTVGRPYAPGYFLAHEECVRETMQMAQADATTASDGSKYIPMGTLYTKTIDDSTDYIGFVYEDVDVTTGDMPGSVVTKGVIYEDRLPESLDSDAKTALIAKGFVFTTVPTVSREDEGGES